MSRSVFLLILLLSLHAERSIGSATPPPPSNERDLLSTKQNPLLEQETRSTLSRNEQAAAMGNRDPGTLGRNLILGRQRAEQMTNLLKDEQLAIALEKITTRGKTILDQSQSLGGPASVLAGAAALWFGVTVRLIKTDLFRVSSRVDGRAGRGDFNLESPFLNSRVFYDGTSGLGLNVNRSLSTTRTMAELNYFSRSRSFSTQLRHPLTEHLNFSVGSSQIPELNNQTDGRAGIEYRLDF